MNTNSWNTNDVKRLVTQSSIDFVNVIMLLWIGISKERITIEKLIELTEVSRNTVLNDLNSIRYQLKEPVP
ncbi:BglG family transcriptional regulator [Streptococcus pneumoniae]|nr:BglG family transcriptional regulator [Streptococcus pneumoniae]